jgi:hypothetical protein
MPRGHHNLLRASAVALLVMALSACGSSLQSAEDYNECVLRGIAVAESPAEAADIRRRCQEQFPGRVSQQRARELPPVALKKLDLDADVEFDEYLNGTAYNGNADLLVTEITIAIEVGEPGQSDTQLYTEQVNMGPLSRSDIGILVEAKRRILNWQIASARGVAR